MGFSCGIIGLPNVGKSTLFNALTSAKAASANFPFCTIEPNTGAVPVPDPRLDKLAELAQSAQIIPTQITFVDIAGLIRGASKGEGLGNQFLGHIRTVDAVAHVVRCFDDDQVIHVDGSVDPIRDIDTIETELTIADYDSIEKQRQKIEKAAKSGDKELKARHEVLQALADHLGGGNPARSFDKDLNETFLAEYSAQLLTAKPVLYVANVSEEDITHTPNPDGDHPVDKVAAYAAKTGSEVIVICGQFESEVAELPKEERMSYIEDMGLEMSGLDRLKLAGYSLLNLLTFFTVGPKEAHAWTITRDTLAPAAAGKIHSDLEKGFIRAEVIGYDDYLTAGSEARAREAGKLRVEGKDYPVQDGDIVHVRFSV